MKIETLFEELEKISEGKEGVFADSGMTNLYKKMNYGFFPLGWGILTENNRTEGLAPKTEIEEGGIMILGNDFGTLKYVKSYIDAPGKKIGEIDSKTINNLKHQRVGLDTDNTFFTNFYLGVRTNERATMTERVESLENDYKELCFNFFLKQLDLIKPRLIICLGHDVKNVLSEICQLTRWKKSDSMKSLYSQNNYSILIEKLYNKQFFIIPHPCDLRNFKQEHIDKLVVELNRKIN